MLSLTHLKYFRDAAMLGGIAPAAQRNRISPSAVSQAIKNLEAHFDAALLSHSRNRFALTAEGKHLLERSHALFTATDRLEDEMKFAKDAYTGEIHFATQQSIAHHLLPQFMVELRQAFPELRPMIKLAPTDVVKRWIETREVEFGLSVDNIAHDSFLSLPIYRGRYVYVESTKAKSAAPEAKAYITPGEATREAITFRREFELKYGKPAHVVMEIKSWGVVKRFAELGMGVGLIPDYLLRFDRSVGLREIDPGLPEIPYEIRAFYCGKRNALSKNCRLFLEQLEVFVKRL
jgi:LysR family carnitine catabolism transcriptional activator